MRGERIIITPQLRSGSSGIHLALDKTLCMAKTYLESEKKQK